jgi:hypothetical protein
MQPQRVCPVRMERPPSFRKVGAKDDDKVRGVNQFCRVEVIPSSRKPFGKVTTSSVKSLILTSLYDSLIGSKEINDASVVSSLDGRREMRHIPSGEHSLITAAQEGTCCPLFKQLRQSTSAFFVPAIC